MDLKRLYNQNNIRYFNGELPRDVALRYSNSMPDDAMSACHLHGILKCEYTGGKNCRGHAIHIRPVFRRFPAIVAMLMFHEQVHLKGLVDPEYIHHDNYFHEDMLRLAKVGAFRDYW